MPKKWDFFFFLKFVPKSVIFTRVYLVDFLDFFFLLRRKSKIFTYTNILDFFFGGEGEDRSNSHRRGRC